MAKPVDEPRLPPELEAEIFAYAASMGDQTATVLMRVAKRVRDWITPILYGVVTFQTPVQLEAFPTHEVQYAEHVQHLLIMAGVPIADEPTLSFITKSKRVYNVAIWTTEYPDQLIDILQTLPIRRLSLAAPRWFPSSNTDSTRPWKLTSFQHLTHLELVCAVDKWEEVVELSDLPNLTHLNWNVPYYYEVVAGSLTNCSKVEVLLLSSLSEPPPLQIDDDRIVYLHVLDWEDEWLVGGKKRNRQGDWWSRAEEVIEERRRPVVKSISQSSDISTSICDKISSEDHVTGADLKEHGAIASLFVVLDES
ncbi:hypothetical protein BDN72DRAFT_881216 [Pluteus cervinus]|uniref:Uncharacterized protein n=1 Tax=Pluteus cervinus TaxID=181527 RepID=A0ACD3AHD9_9AGAR|nr:hypothetical protein BDN72DRAFT_881216 [Pluteus cervinus]